MSTLTLGRFLQTDPIGYKDDVNLYAYVGNDPIDGRDPSGTTCTADEGKYTCKIDNLPQNLSKAQQAAVTAFTKSYTSAVNNLSHSNRTVQITVPGAEKRADGSSVGDRSTRVSSKEVANALAGRVVTYSPGRGGGASTSGNTTTLGDKGLSGGGVLTGIPKFGADLTRQIIITHEGLHGAPTYTDSRLSVGGMGEEPYQSAHQGPYNQGSTDLLGIPR